MGNGEPMIDDIVVGSVERAYCRLCGVTACVTTWTVIGALAFAGLLWMKHLESCQVAYEGGPPIDDLHNRCPAWFESYLKPKSMAASMMGDPKFSSYHLINSEHYEDLRHFKEINRTSEAR